MPARNNAAATADTALRLWGIGLALIVVCCEAIVLVTT